MSQGNIKVTEIKFSNKQLLPEVIRLLNEGHTVTIRLKGYSMRPFLENGRDKALLKKADEIHIGDPVLAEISNSEYVLHRIKGIKGNRVILLGDGNINTEECEIKDIKGSVIGFYRKGRSVLDRTDGKKWKMYSYFWTRLYPIRRYLLFIYKHTCI